MRLLGAIKLVRGVLLFVVGTCFVISGIIFTAGSIIGGYDHEWFAGPVAIVMGAGIARYPSVFSAWRKAPDATSPSTFDDHYGRLVRSMNELETLLGDAGEDFWRDWIRNDLTRIEQGDRYALDHFLGAFGGMGSFTDLIIDPVNGHKISDENIDSVNDRLGVLRSQAWESAKAMRRELEHR